MERWRPSLQEMEERSNISICFVLVQNLGKINGSTNICRYPVVQTVTTMIHQITAGTSRDDVIGEA